MITLISSVACVIIALNLFHGVSATYQFVMSEVDPVEKYNLARIQWDNRPIWWLVGRWENVDPGFGTQLKDPGYPYGDVLDFGIAEMTLFGPRPLNYTGEIHDKDGKILYFEQGYIPVKNSTNMFGRKDDFWPDSRLALLTVNDRGLTILEEGLVTGNRLVNLSIKAAIVRSFEQPRHVDGQLYMDLELQRMFFIQGDRLFQYINSTINAVQSSQLIVYKKVRGMPCLEACEYVEDFLQLEDTCQLCEDNDMEKEFLTNETPRKSNSV